MDAFSCYVNKKNNTVSREHIYCTYVLHFSRNSPIHFVAVMSHSDRLKTSNIAHQKSLKYAQNGALIVDFRSLVSYWEILNLLV